MLINANRTITARRAIGMVVVIAAATLPATFVKASDDGGVGAFFREQFGIGQAPAPAYPVPEDRPLIVRPHHHVAKRHTDTPTKVVVGPTVPVSIYDDKTLRAGDAVMTAKGLRVFVGGGAAPFTDADFVAVSDVSGMPKQVEKALVAIDKAPHG